MVHLQDFSSVRSLFPGWFLLQKRHTSRIRRVHGTLNFKTMHVWVCTYVLYTCVRIHTTYAVHMCMYVCMYYIHVYVYILHMLYICVCTYVCTIYMWTMCTYYVRMLYVCVCMYVLYTCVRMCTHYICCMSVLLWLTLVYCVHTSGIHVRMNTCPIGQFKLKSCRLCTHHTSVVPQLLPTTRCSDWSVWWGRVCSPDLLRD